MAGSTNKIKVELEGKDRSLGRTMKKAGGEASTFSGKLKLIGRGIKQLLKGDFKGLGQTIKSLGSGFGALGKVAGIAGAAVVAAIGAMIAFILKAKRSYEDWMVQIATMRRLSGMTAEATSRLAVQFRLSGVDAKKGATGLRMFAKGLDAAQQGTGTTGDAFKRLGVDLKDADGKWRSMEEVLADTRDRMSEMKNGSEKTAIAMKLFGRGGSDLLPWLSKSTEEMRRYVKWASELGLVMGKRSLDAFSKYRENQRKLSLGWDAIKINAYAALVPLINKLMPHIIRLIWTASGWIGRFRKQVEKKGWESALKKMVPQLDNIWSGLKSAWDYAKKFGAYIVGHKEDIKKAFQDILLVINAIAGALSAAVTTARYLAGLVTSTSGERKGRGGGQRGGGKSRGGQHGGIFSGPTSGYPVTMHGTEAIVPLARDRASDAARVLAAAGLLGGGNTVVNVYLDSEPIAARVEVRQTQRARRYARTAGAPA